ncbi:MAG: glutamine--fructose-6-phosphate transaminase (isomerizing) [Alphaproteobacteria bacterium]|nr:glutamine--fructose-6-phosphate transaminase (isomerizing) [Alphaproteobacteria bacterium]
MCGIIGIIGVNEVTPYLVESLKRLEYRGYDSAGVATISDGVVQRRRAEGKIVNLEQRLADEPTTGTLGIGHTRWATHGAANETNAHPHSDGRVVVVHNGIIENYQALRDRLTAAGRIFESETDSEVVVHLIASYLDDGLDHEAAVQAALGELQGAYALTVLFADRPDILIGARHGPPLAVGFGDGEMFVGSDALALAQMTQKIAYLEDGDWVVLTRDGMSVRNQNGTDVQRDVRETAMSGALIGKGEYRHFMIKEIHEQPQVVGDTLTAFINPGERTVALPELPFDLGTVPKVTIVGCGTAYLAGLIAKYWIEQTAGVPVDVDIASEFRYREPPLSDDGLALFISQSGETADTLAALRYCKTKGQHIVSIVNATESTIARESDAILHTLAGSEIGVASTKAFTTQLAVLASLAVGMARSRDAIDLEAEQHLMTALAEVPARMAEFLHRESEVHDIAQSLIETQDVLYLGRGLSYPIALEGALKLKEISYIHAEGYAAGEMKHGPIALVDEHMPVVVLAPSDNLFPKTVSNIEQVVARGGSVIAVTDSKGRERLDDLASHIIEVPAIDPLVVPLLYSVPVQLLAYHTAVLKGTDVDQPRNLAKSVTVE